jgi:hypothetical protein
MSMPFRPCSPPRTAIRCQRDGLTAIDFPYCHIGTWQFSSIETVDVVNGTRGLLVVAVAFCLKRAKGRATSTRNPHDFQSFVSISGPILYQLVLPRDSHSSRMYCY